MPRKKKKRQRRKVARKKKGKKKGVVRRKKVARRKKAVRRKKRRRAKLKPKPKPKPKRLAVEAFEFPPGRKLAGKYQIVSLLGTGWEGEVYKIREIPTGIERAAKFFFPQRNPRNRTSNWYAKKLHKLRDCPIVIQYQTQETILYRRTPITFLVSEFVEGIILEEFLQRQPGGRLTPFQGLHLLYSLATGIERIHSLGEYHGDLHSGNIIVRRHGIGFSLKLLDMFHWGAPRQENIYDDVCDLVRILYDTVGGVRHYPRQPPEIKDICCGLKRSLILRKFRTAGQLREYLETREWE